MSPPTELLSLVDPPCCLDVLNVRCGELEVESSGLNEDGGCWKEAATVGGDVTWWN